MSLLSYNQLMLLIDDGVITHTRPELVNSASIDLQLGRKLLIERISPNNFTDNKLNRVILKDRQALNMIEHDLVKDGSFIMYPGEFILAHTEEIFNLPNNISSKYVLKSSMARIGLEHLNAGWCDAGWHGSALTLELKNVTRHHEIVLHYKDLIGQMCFFLHDEVPEDKSYAVRGRYNNDKTVSGAKLRRKAIILGDNQEDTYQEEFEKNHPTPEIIPEVPKKVIEVNEAEEGTTTN